MRKSGPKKKVQRPNLTLQSFSTLVAVRVTRLDEFSPIGRLLSLSSVMKISEIAKTIWLLFSDENAMH
jgi:hypothetical protein